MDGGPFVTPHLSLPLHLRLAGAFLTFCALILVAATKAEAEYTFTLIADSTGPFNQFGTAPSLNSILNSSSLNTIFSASINDAGTLAFRAHLGQTGSDTGIFTSNGRPITTVADSSGFLKSFGKTPSINGAGGVAFSAGVGDLDSGTFGIYSGNGGPLTTIADISGPFSSFSFNDFT